ncbi:ABC transporter permease [Mycobacterium intracellulare subsp. chimaera]|jgi:phospholipid/cholesterol/gamma-HCH transport system permease protein|uniref:MlaE family ABC transporter permease n=1 Tax=Mycobacterium intracellulare TaxID=1767 RepID=UPI000B8C6F3D|nr:ABC transporter permease [Mycobacterium intracellulare]ASQ84627.1 ABC transporter permease [Mycobacterium intracellulare subsp. chimaera]
MTSVSRAEPSLPFSARLVSARPVREFLRVAGQWVVFISQTLLSLPLTVIRYRRQTLQQMNSLAWGRGSLIVDGGVVSVLLILGIAVGAATAIEAFSVLNIIGFGALSGIVAGVGAVREIGPLVGGIAFATQTGCRMTAEIGSMRIADEIDAVEAMALRPIPFVVGTRLLGGMVCVIPGYLLTLVSIFFAMELIIRLIGRVPGGTYSHYFIEFLTPTDLAYSVIKVVVYSAAATVIHCYYGYFVTGGPVGVGQASGRAVRTSLVTIMILDFATTTMLWGIRPEFVFKG